ncbi:MAG: VOC family protein [Steroidobacteraceae bacterium]
MKQSIGQVALVVQDYDAAIEFYLRRLGFTLIEDTPVDSRDKRWVIVVPSGSSESRLLLARAAGEVQAARIGDQTDGRVFLFLYTDDFWRDYRSYQARCIIFVRPPRDEPYGTVAVFQDLYGNLCALIQRK